MFKYSFVHILRLQPGALVMQHSSSPCDSAIHQAVVHNAGMMLALAVFHGDNIPIRLAPPLLKQVSDHLHPFLHTCTYLYMLLLLPFVPLCFTVVGHSSETSR